MLDIENMSVKENAQALQAMAALLPETDPLRRDLEADAYLLWRQINPKRAKALAKGWTKYGLSNFDRLLPKLYRCDPKQAQAIAPSYGREDYCELWLQMLLEDWEEGDGFAASYAINACNHSNQRLPMAPILIHRLPAFAAEDCEDMAVPLVRQVCRYFLGDLELLAKVIQYAGEAESAPAFLECLCVLVLEIYPYEVRKWHRRFRKATDGHSGPAVKLVKELVLARNFEMRYSSRNPRIEQPQLTGGWQRLQKATVWIEQLPTEKVIARVKEEQARLQQRMTSICNERRKV